MTIRLIDSVRFMVYQSSTARFRRPLIYLNSQGESNGYPANRPRFAGRARRNLSDGAGLIVLENRRYCAYFPIICYFWFRTLGIRLLSCADGRRKCP